MKKKSDLELRDEIEKIHLKFPGYGHRRIRRHFLKQGVRINHKRIRRIMRQFSLFSVLKHTFKPPEAPRRSDLAYPNLIKGIEIKDVNELWAADLTYIRIEKEFINLAAIIDVYSRRIVGWSIGRTIDHKLCLMALDAAIKARNPKPGCIHHSDRGLQYTSEAYVSRLKEAGMRPSMSAIATPQDNAYIESFFKTLKHEEVFVRDYETIQEVIQNLPRFIEEVYNLKRMHSSLGYLAPIEFEAELQTKEKSAYPVQKLAS